MTEWISVEEELPYPNEVVLVCDQLNAFVSLGKLKEEGQDFSFKLMYIEAMEIDSFVTHWMNFPPPPVTPPSVS